MEDERVPGMRSPRGPGRRQLSDVVGQSGLAWAAILLLALLVIGTVVAVAVPDLRVAVPSPTGRVALEVVSAAVTLFAVLALLLPDDGDTPVTRNAFVASLVVLAASNVVFGLGPLVVSAASVFDGLLGLYPWVAARYLSGLLFIAAGLGRPRWHLRWYLLAAALGVALIVGVFVGVREQLPLPFEELAFTDRGVLVPVPTSGQGFLVVILPGLLFAAGAWLAARLWWRGASPLYLWVAAGLGVQVLARVHETLYAAVLGPVITTADALRLVFLAFLLTGAVLKVRQVVVDRGAAVAALEGDIRAREEVLDRMAGVTEREQVFRSLVVHELATPIAALRTFAHVLARPDRSPPELLATAAEGVEAESGRLQSLVDRMEELRDLESRDVDVDLRPLPLRPVLAEAATYLRGLSGGHPIVVEWGCGDVVVDADPVRFGQALRNVLANAARYSPERAPVTVRCEPGPDDRVRVVVCDRGPGIAPEERERVLRPFERGSAGRGRSGSGLGLYLSARIMEAHNGRLHIADAPGGGTAVTLELRTATRPG